MMTRWKVKDPSKYLIDGQVKDIPGFPGYLASDQGTVYSCWRAGYQNYLAQTPRALSSGTTPKGYRYVYIRNENGVWKTPQVHTLVMRAFRGKTPDGMEICHENGDPSDNRLVNLRFDTRKNNHQDKWKHGTSPHGETHHNAKLSRRDVANIRQRYDSGESPSKISKDFPQVTYSAVYSVCQRKVRNYE